MKIYLAIQWSIVFALICGDWAAGRDATWFQVFLPSIILFCDLWIDCLTRKL